MSDKDTFYVWCNFCRYAPDGTRIAPRRKKKVNLQVEEVKVLVGTENGKKMATIRFTDGTYTKPFQYNYWSPRSRLAVIAVNFIKWNRYRGGREL